MKTMNEMMSVIVQNDYYKNFWDAMKFVPNAAYEVTNALDASGVSYLPAESEKKFRDAITGASVIRSLATRHKKYDGSSIIWAYNSDDYADFVDEGDTIPGFDVADDFSKICVNSFKIASLAKVSSEFATDVAFDIEGYIMHRFAKSFAKTEDKAFISGTGTGEPTGLLHDTLGAETGVTTSALTYDDCLDLFFSVKPEYRKSSVWLMNDKTALALRKLKDEDGNYLWNSANDTILGKPVIISNEMPDIESGKKPVLFGDLSFYWIIDRSPMSIQVIKELFATNHQIGYIGSERLDGKLIRSEAVKVIATSDEE